MRRVPVQAVGQRPRAAPTTGRPAWPAEEELSTRVFAASADESFGMAGLNAAVLAAQRLRQCAELPGDRPGNQLFLDILEQIIDGTLIALVSQLLGTSPPPVAGGLRDAWQALEIFENEDVKGKLCPRCIRELQARSRQPAT